MFIQDSVLQESSSALERRDRLQDVRLLHILKDGIFPNLGEDMSDTDVVPLSLLVDSFLDICTSMREVNP